MGIGCLIPERTWVWFLLPVGTKGIPMARQPLYELVDDAGSSTALTPLSPGVRRQLQAAAVAPTALDEVDTAISQAIAKLTAGGETPAAAVAPPPPRVAIAASALPPRPLWLWGLAGGLALSLAGNVFCALTLRSASYQLRPSGSVSGAVDNPVATPNAGAGGPLAPLAIPPCARNSTQTITGAERDRLLLNALREHDAGRRLEALQLFKLYVSEACDTATLQAVAILERELAPPRSELATSP